MPERPIGAPWKGDGPIQGTRVRISHLLPDNEDTVEHKQVIILRKDLNMRKGKLVAQGAHASMGAILKQMTVTADNKMVLDLNDARLAPWVTGRFKKICVYVNSEQELLDLHKQATEAGLITSLIQDAGLTEFGGVKTFTAVGIGPDSEDKIDAVCKHLPLF